MKRLDRKLANILAGNYRRSDFVIADAKDGDMGFATTAPGPVLGPDGQPMGRLKTLEDYFAQIREIVDKDLCDIMLLSLSSFYRLDREGLFAKSDIMPAIRCNDSTDIWNNRNATYLKQPSRPFRNVDLNSVKAAGGKLGLYSMTFTNDVDRDLTTLQAYKDFRVEATALGIDHFLEVFNPNVDAGLSADQLGPFVNDAIVRALAGVADFERPRFLKIAYNGAQALEELVAYDDQIIVGILGGSSGTTADTFNLIQLSEKHGARVVLFGRKINLAESPTDILMLMRQMVEGNITPDDAVKAYHGALQEKGLAPKRPLEEDRQVTEKVLANDL
jgi:hypothetical protein